MRIRQIPILMDNYAHLLVCESTNRAGVVDPAQPDVVAAAIEAEGVELTHILVTHHHWDHSGGNLEMKKRFPSATVVGAAADADRIPALDHPVAGGDSFAIGDIDVSVLFVPCHTRGHIAFLADDALFCGDTLFVAGCGRFFEGDAEQMNQALNGVFAALPDSTRVFCGHEYTVSNLNFASTIEPDNAAVASKAEWAKAEIAAGRSTVPSTIGEERTYNPFMRVHLEAVQRALDAADPVSAMAALREKKNTFRG